MLQSSAYRQNRWPRRVNSWSNSSSTRLLNRGDSGPPCGAPSVVGLTKSFSMTPTSRNARINFCWVFRDSFRRGWFGPFVFRVRSFTPTVGHEGQLRLPAPGFLPQSTHELQVLLAAPNRSGLRHVAAALRSLTVSAILGQCLDRAGRRHVSNTPSADFCVAVRAPHGPLSPEFRTRRNLPR